MGLENIKFLNGLRGLAILMVICFHLFNFSILSYVTRLGWLGVNLFFVLSGFLITNILISIDLNNSNIFKFYIRRMLRIFPVYFLTLFVAFFLLKSFFEGTLPQYDSLAENQIFFFTYLQNYFYIYTKSGYSTLLNHTWSLAIEEHFYLLWPLVLKGINKNIYIVLFLIFLIYIMRWNSDDKVASYVATHLRIDAIMIGGLAAMIYHHKSFRMGLRYLLMGFSILVISLLILYITHPSADPVESAYIRYGYTIFEVSIGILIYTLCKYPQKLHHVISFLESKLMVFFGKYSYGLYLFHWPILIWLKVNMFAPSRTIFESLVLGCITFLLSLLLAVVSYDFFESKILLFKDRFQYSSIQFAI